MSKEKQIDEMDLAVLNCYRNKYYTDGNSTEQGIIANAINEVLPILVSLKNGGYRKQSEGEWLYSEKHCAYICSECEECAPVDDFREQKLTKFCPDCGAKMKGGAD